MKARSFVRPLVFTTLSLSLAACGQQSAPPAAAQAGTPGKVSAQVACSTVATRLVTLGYTGAYFAQTRTDSQGNIYVVGTLQGARTPFVRKYMAGGTEAWTRTFGSSDDSTSHAVSLTVDGGGNAYVSAVVSEATLPGPSAPQYTLHKYDPNGNELWAKSNVGQFVYGSLGVDASGNLYVSGTAADASLGGAISKYTSAGALIWQRPLPSFSIISVAPDGTWFSVSGAAQVTLSKHTRDGWLIGTKTFGSSQSARPLQVVASKYGSVYTLYRTIDAGVSRFALNKYNARFEWQWASTLATTDASEPLLEDVALDAQGKLYVLGNTGLYRGTDASCERTGPVDAFVAKYDPDTGTELWAKQFETGGTNNPWGGQSVTVDPAGAVLVAGGQTSYVQDVSDSAFITRLP